MNSEDVAKLISKKKKEGSFVFVCGNGGSAANAEHFTNDLLSRGVRAICLNSNVSVVTMIANDYGYEYIFSKQLEVYASAGDLLVMVSCSGTSKNILEAKSAATHIGMNVLPLFGGSGTYEDMENVHLEELHEVVKFLGVKMI